MLAASSNASREGAGSGAGGAGVEGAVGGAVDPVNALLGDLGMAASERLGCGDDAVVGGAEGGDGGRGGGGVGVDGHGTRTSTG